MLSSGLCHIKTQGVNLISFSSLKGHKEPDEKNSLSQLTGILSFVSIVIEIWHFRLAKFRYDQKKRVPNSMFETLITWEHTDSNRGPSACKADALNQLSYAPE